MAGQVCLSMNHLHKVSYSYYNLILGSFIEFIGLLKLLQKRYTPSTLPYHIIVPSLPGFGLSSPPPLDRDFVCEDAAAIINAVMVNLGFGDAYIAQGGDVGSYIARVIGVLFEGCKAVHSKSSWARYVVLSGVGTDFDAVNYCFTGEPTGINPQDVTEEEQQGILRARDFATFGVGYGIEHASRPSTIGLVLQSNPLAFLAWYVSPLPVPLSRENSAVLGSRRSSTPGVM